MSKWMTLKNAPESAHIAVFRCKFTAKTAGPLSFRFSADEHAQIFLDGERVCEGPERGVPERWYWKDVTTQLTAGEHVLSARVLCFGKDSAYGQLTVKHGFCLQSSSLPLENWECREENGLSFTMGYPDWGNYPRAEVSNTYCDQVPYGGGGGWLPVEYFEDNRPMAEAELPDMRYEEVTPVKKDDDLYYFEHYTCSWSTIEFEGNGIVKVAFVETPYLRDNYKDWREFIHAEKGNRDGKCFVTNYDVFHVNGHLKWHNYWWRAGHYVKIVVEGDVKYKIRYFKTGYPLPEYKGTSPIARMAVETMQACMSYTYMDCPYFEQMQYIGDTRITVNCTYLLTDDHRLPAKALRIFSLSQQPDGAIMSRYPTKDPQYIPSYMTIWLLMLHDYWKRNGRDRLVEDLLPAANRLLDYFVAQSKDGLVDAPGWNFVDWCDGWDFGAPLKGDAPDSMNNWLLVIALRRLNEIGFRKGLVEWADNIAARLRAKYYNAERKLYAIDAAKTQYSEHSQVLAILAGENPETVSGLRAEKLTECSIYFSYYYAAACRQAGWEDLVKARMKRWKTLLNQPGLTTLPEEFVLPRSDCHAWGAYILMYPEAIE